MLDLEERQPWTAGAVRDFAETLARELQSIEDKIACLSLSRDTVRAYLKQTRHAALIDA